MDRWKRKSVSNETLFVGLLILVSILSVRSAAQVHIQENVAITPYQGKKTQGVMINNHSIRIVYSWDTGYMGRVPAWCIGEVYGNSPIVVNVPGAQAGTYYGDGLQVNQGYGEGPTIHAYSKIFYDDSLVLSDSVSMQPYSGCCWTIWDEGFLRRSWTTPYFTKFQFSLASNMISHGASTEMSMQGIFDRYHCNDTIWSSRTEPVSLAIIKGSQYASFHTLKSKTGSDVKLGQTTITVGDSIEDIYLIADSVQPDQNGDWVVVKAESNGIVGLDSVRVLPSPTKPLSGIVAPKSGTLKLWPQYVYKSSMTPALSGAYMQISVNDTLKYQFDVLPFLLRYSTSNVWNSEDTVYYDNEQSNFDDNCSKKSGLFTKIEYYDKVHTTLSDPPDSVYSITVNKGDTLRFLYGAMWEAPGVSFPAYPMTDSGGVFLVYGRFPDPSYCWFDGCCPAFPGDYCEFLLKYQTEKLKILTHAPWSIWPDLPPGAYSANESVPGYNPLRTFAIQVTDQNGNPVKDAAVEIIHNYQRGTGGHVHGGSSNVIPPQSLQGIFYGKSGSGPSLELTTDQNGMAYVNKYLASQISGTYLITAYLKSDPSVMDSVNLNVEVPELVNFRDLVFLPNDQKPYTFSQSTAGDENHPDNDYCTPAMGDSLFLGILDFYDWSASQNEGGIPVVISLNDMSLPWGGLFDAVNADWHLPHQWHRIGRSVDINNPDRIFQYPDLNNPKLPVLTNLGWWLKYWISHHHGSRVTEGKSVHYEFYNAY